MKRYNKIYEKIYDIENLKKAHQMAKKDKSHYHSVQMVEQDLDNKLLRIQDLLKNKKYKPSNYKISIITDKNKQRLLHKLPYYPDRIIQWAIMLQVEEIFVKTFTNFTCASLKGRGTKYATSLLTKYLQDKDNCKYCLKIDINKFYPSINRQILKNMLRKKFKDKELLWLLDIIIDSTSGINVNKLNIPSSFKEIYFRENKGLPIGSYLSQYLANFYLSYFDHWLKEELKCKYVVRYMDDIIILDNSKEFLHKVRKEISNYLEEKLDLQLKDNWQIFPVSARGIDFVGYRHFFNYRLLRKSIVKNMKKSLKRFSQNPTIKSWFSCISYYGWISSCNGYNLFYKYYKAILFQLNKYYCDNIKSSKRRGNFCLSLSNFLNRYAQQPHLSYHSLSHALLHK